MRWRPSLAAGRRAEARERGLLAAGGALRSAADPAEVARAVRQAVAGLLPPGTPHAVILAPEPDIAGARATRVSTRGARRRPAGSDAPAPATPRGELISTGDPAGELRTAVEDFPLALRWTLPCADGRSPARVLYIAAAEPALTQLAGTFGVLAAQAAMALDRIALADEVGRHRGQAHYRSLVHSTSDVLMIIDEADRVRYASPSAATVFGVEAPVGMHLADFLEPDEHPRLPDLLNQVRAGLHQHSVLDFRGRRTDGTTPHVEIDCRDLRDDPDVNGLVVSIRDVTERRLLEREVAHQSFHDPLTGLANRALFRDRVAHALARSHRDGSVIGVLFLDLDDFTSVNDAFGPAAADELLIAFAKRLSGVVRAHDTTARLGGDEFAVLLDGQATVTDIEQLAERILEALDEPFAIGEDAVAGRACIGIASSVDGIDTNAAELLRQAGMALSAAKSAGPGLWRRYRADLPAAVVERVELRAALGRALAENQFLLRYQPIVDLSSGDAVGVEALVRWDHPTRGLVPPGQFITAAEESGQIVPLGRWVLREALTALARWQHRVPADRLRYLSVNVSARQVQAPGFVEDVQQALRDSGVPARTLMLEITESLLLRENDQVWADLEQLRAMGVQIAVDDFGTGYSSLSYLRRLPIDVLKIDKSFVDDILESRQQRAVLTAIVQLADILGLRVVAEGIEESGQRQLLQDMGCPYAQGYLFAPPLAEDEALALLDAAAAAVA